MQTVYYTIRRPARPNNVIDLQSYRQQRSLALPAVPCEPEEPLNRPRQERRERPASRLEQVGRLLDAAASVALSLSAVLALAALL